MMKRLEKLSNILLSIAVFFMAVFLIALPLVILPFSILTLASAGVWISGVLYAVVYLIKMSLPLKEENVKEPRKTKK